MKIKLRKYVLLPSLLFGFAVSVPAWSQYVGGDSPAGLPHIRMKDGSDCNAGRAFAIQWFRNRKLLVMPLHLLGPGGGYPTYVEAKDVPDKVDIVEVMDFPQKNVVATAGPGLLRTGVPVEKAMGNICEDLMAFELKSNPHLPLMALCPTMAPVGTKVTVLTKVLPTTTTSPDRFSGRVVRSLSTGMTIELDGTLTALSSSGSPVVNDKNEVVCMMVGKQDGRRTIVMGIPSTMLYAKLYRELGR